MVKKIPVILVFILFLLLPGNAFAEDFATSYDVLYDIGSDGVTSVTEKISLKNLTSEKYANEFKLTIGATEIFDIKASDSTGGLEITSEKKNSSTTIGVKFGQQVAGLGKTLTWSLFFKSNDFAEKTGKIWEIRAPKISPSANLEDYNLTVSVPQDFGDLSMVSPLPKSRSVSGGKIFLTFNKEQLQSSGVSASFGTNQLFDFDLMYHLQNPNLIPILTTIALPPDTSFQDVIFQRIEPKPINVTVDPDGNYLGWYRLNRGEKLDVRVIGSAKLYTNSKVRNPHLSSGLKAKYTAEDKYWEKTNPQITAKLKEILTADSLLDTEEKAGLIYRFVVDYLKYDSDRLKNNTERLGAVTVLNNPEKAVCMEFTDLLITLLRAADIPARELDGFAHTSNPALRPLSLTKDILHAWPEYWDDKRGWVMVDPTWENTTGGVDYFNRLDLNHFVFAIKGSSAEEPIPAGAYKYEGQNTNDVKVTLSEADFLGKSQIKEEVEVSNPIIAGFPATLKIKLINEGNSFYPSAPIAATANKLAVVNTGNGETGIIPAYGAASFEFKIRAKSLLDSYSDTITVSVGNQKFTRNVMVKPLLLLQPVQAGIGAVTALMILIYLAVLGTHMYKSGFFKNKGK